MDTPDSDTVEIVGLTDSPVIVKDGVVQQSEPAAEQDVMAEMAAAVAADQPKEEKPAEEKPAEEAPEAPADDAEKPDIQGEPDKPDADKSVDADAEKKSEEDKSDEEKKPEGEEEEKPAEEEKPEAEPSEAEKLVEDLGGVEVIKAAEGLIKAVYNPDLPVSERVEALRGFIPDAQMGNIENELFWQAVEKPEIQTLLKEDEEFQNIIVSDKDVRETFAQKAFGVPYGFLEKIIAEQKVLYSDEELATYKPAGDEVEDEPQVEKKAAPAKEEAKPKEELKPEEVEFTPEFDAILGDLAGEVGGIVATAKLDEGKPEEAAVLKKFEEEWPAAFKADEKLVQAFRDVQGLAVAGTEKLARDKYPVLARHAKRVAAQLLEKVKEPLNARRLEKQEKVQPKQTASTKVSDAPPAKEALPDLHSKEFDELFAQKAGGD